MTEPARKLTYTFTEYLALEAKSETKHEYINGEVFAMAGGTPDHAALAAAVIRLLGTALLGRPYRVYTSDLRIRVLATGLATYPDVSIICRPFEPDPEDPNTAVNPVVIAEVLSDSTEAYDRGEKFAHYRRIPSLRDYLLVVQREARIEHYRRNEDDTWTLREVRAPGAVRLSIGCELSVEDVYLDPMAEPA